MQKHEQMWLGYETRKTGRYKRAGAKQLLNNQARYSKTSKQEIKIKIDKSSTSKKQINS